MAKKCKRILKIELYQVRPAEWVSYSIENCKIEISQVDKIWVASVTIDDPYGLYQTIQPIEVASLKNVALNALLATSGFPYLLEWTTDTTKVLSDFYDEISTYWQAADGDFYKEDRPILGGSSELRLSFREFADGSWVCRYFNLACIEAVKIDSEWLIVAKSTGEAGSVTSAINEISITDIDLHQAVRKLLTRKGLPFIFGLSHDVSSRLRDIYPKILLQWNDYSVIPGPYSTTKTHLRVNSYQCAWRHSNPDCDDSGNCKFCASYGSAYFMRWDD